VRAIDPQSPPAAELLAALGQYQSDYTADQRPPATGRERWAAGGGIPWRVSTAPRVVGCLRLQPRMARGMKAPLRSPEARGSGVGGLCWPSWERRARRGGGNCAVLRLEKMCAKTARCETLRAGGLRPAGPFAD